MRKEERRPAQKVPKVDVWQWTIGIFVCNWFGMGGSVANTAYSDL